MTMTPQMDLFAPPLADPTIQSHNYVELKTQQKITGQGQHVFHREGDDNLLDLGQSFLKVRAKIVKGNGDAIAFGEKMGPINNVLHSLFTKVTVELGGLDVQHSNNLYAYQSYITDLLISQSGENQLKAQGFILDAGGTFLVKDPTADIANEGLDSRKSMFMRSREVDLVGRLHCDVFRQNRFILNNVSLRVTLHRSSDTFMIQGDNTDGVGWKMVITDMTLLLKTAKPTQMTERTLEKNLMETPAIYPMERTVMKYFIIPPGSSMFNAPTLFQGKLPKMVIFGLIKDESRTGGYANNAFDFATFNVNHVHMTKNGVALGSANGLRPNLSPNTLQSSEAYTTLLQNIGMLGKGCKFDIWGFLGGFAFYAFNLAVTDPFSNVDSLTNAKGTLALDLSFNRSPTNALQLIVFGLYDSVMTIDSNRNVKIEMVD